jgi:hypothetical protein
MPSRSRSCDNEALYEISNLLGGLSSYRLSQYITGRLHVGIVNLCKQLCGWALWCKNGVHQVFACAPCAA